MTHLVGPLSSTKVACLLKSNPIINTILFKPTNYLFLIHSETFFQQEFRHDQQAFDICYFNDFVREFCLLGLLGYPCYGFYLISELFWIFLFRWWYYCWKFLVRPCTFSRQSFMGTQLLSSAEFILWVWDVSRDQWRSQSLARVGCSPAQFF